MLAATNACRPCTFPVHYSTDFAAAADYNMSLAANSSLLMQLALTHLPSFGVIPGSVRSVALNSSAVEAYPTSSGTLYLIHLEYTVLIVGFEAKWLRVLGFQGLGTVVVTNSRCRSSHAASDVVLSASSLLVPNPSWLHRAATSASVCGRRAHLHLWPLQARCCRCCRAAAAAVAAAGDYSPNKAIQTPPLRHWKSQMRVAALTVLAVKAHTAPLLTV